MEGFFRFLKDYPIILIGVCLGAVGVFSVWVQVSTQSRLDEQQNCIQAFLSAQSDNTTLRAQLVEDDAKNTSFIIRTVLFNVHTRPELKAAALAWQKEADRINAERKANPPKKFNNAACARLVNP